MFSIFCLNVPSLLHLCWLASEGHLACKSITLAIPRALSGSHVAKYAY